MERPNEDENTVSDGQAREAAAMDRRLDASIQNTNENAADGAAATATREDAQAERRENPAEQGGQG
jgi:hypothetical protein